MIPGTNQDVDALLSKAYEVLIEKKSDNNLNHTKNRGH